MPDVSLQDVMLCPTLPSLPVVAVRLLELTADPDVAMSDIVALVQQDQALAAKVLKTVNSSFYGLSSPCGSIDRAMGYLGLNTVKSLVLGFSLVETTRGADEHGLDLEAHWRRAIIGATGARVVASAVGGVDPEEAFTAALFQDMGMLACFATIKEDYTGVIRGVAHHEVCRVEHEALGFDHAVVGAALAGKWKLPDELCQAIRHHHTPELAPKAHGQIVQVVALGAMINAAMEPGAPASAVRVIERHCKRWYAKRPLDVGGLLGEVADTAKTLAKMFDQEIGAIPDTAQLMARAQEMGFEHQIGLQREADRLAREANIDGLTRIANRKCFDAELERVYHAFIENGTGFGVLFFDADRFKSVNDTHGHAAGDVVLIELARRCSQVIGDEGIVCRYGGEEFAVIVPGKDLDACAALAEGVRAAIGGTPFDLRSVDGTPDELVVTASIGVSGTDAGNPARLAGADQVVHEADECVYAAKSDGRNNVKVWGRFSQVTIQNDAADQKGSGPVLADQRIDPSVLGGRILLVEDDSLAATLVISLIKRRSKVDIRWVKSGTQACMLIESGELSGKNAPNLILCDFGLPGCNGHEVLRVAKGSEHMSGVPFIMLTGSNDEHMRDESLRRGASLFIHKDEFCADVNKWLGELVSSSRSAA